MEVTSDHPLGMRIIIFPVIHLPRSLAMGVWQVAAMDSLKFHPGLPCPTLLCPVGEPPLKQPYGHDDGRIQPNYPYFEPSQYLPKIFFVGQNQFFSLYFL
jgi:hypothetical protein